MTNRIAVAAALCGLVAGAGGVAVLHAAGAAQPKGYLVGEIDVHDMDTYRTYAAQAPAILARHGGKYLARGGQTVSYEGAAPASRFVIVEFPTVAAARAFYESPEYRAASQIRQKASNSRMFLAEGFTP